MIDNTSKTGQPKTKLAPIFWGTLFVSLGSAILLQKYGIISFQEIYFTSILSILLIIIGISFLQVPVLFKKILVGMIAIIVSISGVSVFNSIHSGIKDNLFNSNWKHNTSNSTNIIEYANIRDSANLLIQSRAIELNISSIATKSLKYSADDLRASQITHDSTYSNYELYCSPKSQNSLKNGFTGDLQLSDSTVWTITAKIGASELNADFSDMRISKLFINSGASEINLKFGNKQMDTEIFIESGASDIEINIPYDAYCEITTNTALTSSNFKNFDEINPGYFKAGSYDSLNSKFIISINGGVSNFNINRVK